MGQLIVPTDNKIQGPWLLDRANIEELHETISIVETKLNTSYELEVEKRALNIIEEYKRRGEEHQLDKAKQLVRESYTFQSEEKSVELFSAEGKKIQDNSLINLLKDPNLKDFKPTGIRVQMSKGPAEFKLEIDSTYNGELKTRTKVPYEESLNDINYELQKWIDKHIPPIHIQKWSSWFPEGAFLIAFIVLIITSSISESRKELYQEQLSIRAQELLNKGINSENVTDVLTILLQKELEYIPENYDPNPEINTTIGMVWIITLLAIFILTIRPKTTVGIGKNAWKVRFYRKWIYFVSVFLPLSIILPLVRSKLM